MFFDPLYMLFMLPGILLALWAQAKVMRAFHHYKTVANSSGMTGAQVAQLILDRNSITDVSIVEYPGTLSDHYNPLSKELALSSEIYHGRSVAAMGIAAHEVGHALQHAQGYAMLKFRSAWVPVAATANQITMFLFLIGIFFKLSNLVLIGIACFAAITVFTLITLPVEFNASSRAVQLLGAYGVVRGEEEQGVRKVLNAAAMTYVAAFITSLMQLLYFIMLFLNSRDRD